MEEIGVKEYKIKLVAKKNLAANFWVYEFEKPEGFRFLAGQYISIKVSEKGERRSYSLSSWPGVDNLQIVVDVTPMGVGSKYLLDIKKGDQLEMMGPVGRFFVDEEQQKETTKGYMFIGTGSGVTPLWSMVNDLLNDRKETRPIKLRWGMKLMKDLFWQKELVKLKQKYKNFEYDIVLSREEGAEWKKCRGHVEDCLAKEEGDLSGWQTYLCGNKKMIEEVGDMLVKEHNVDEGSVHFEKFY